jgi:hypothetical protein
MVAGESIDILTKRQQNYLSCFRLLESIVQRYSNSNILPNDFYWMAILAEYCDTLIDNLNPNELNLLKYTVINDGLRQMLISQSSLEFYDKQKHVKNRNTDFYFFIEKYFIEDQILSEFFIKIIDAQLLKCKTNCKKKILEITKDEGIAAVNAFLFLIEQRNNINIKTHLKTDLKRYLIKMEHLLSISDDFLDLNKDFANNIKMVNQKLGYRLLLARRIIGSAFSLMVLYPKQFITDFIRFNRLYFFTRHSTIENKTSNEERNLIETRQIQLGQSTTF